MEDLKTAFNQLVRGFCRGENKNFSEEYTRLLDDYFIKAFERSSFSLKADPENNPFAILAVGGYGRREMCIFSDIDVIFLFKEKIPEDTEDLIREIIYPLWDFGFDVSYRVFSLEEYMSLIKEDMREVTSVLNARFVCGQSKLYVELMEQVRERIIKRMKERIINWLIEQNDLRHKTYGDSSYLLEPNLKEGRGGLRDYHTILWIGKLDSYIREPKDLEIFGYITHAGFETLMKILLFMWNVRNWLHYFSKKKNDRLYLEYQKKVAKRVGFSGKSSVERFLGELHRNMELLKDTYITFLMELGYLKRKKRKEDLTEEGIEVRNNLLYFRSSEDILSSPVLLIKIFEESQRLGIPLSSETKFLVREFSFLIDENIRKKKEAVRLFEKLLIAPLEENDVLEDMLCCGLLERLIPQFKGIINKIQYDEYHRYPVDKHSLKTVQILKSFEKEDADPLYRKLYREITQKKLLLWAGLLHDIGKAVSRKDHPKKGADIAKKILRDFGYKEKQIELVRFLIENHLFLIKTATRRDINDEEVAIHCAKKIGDSERLKMLYLLTVADSMATGPFIWNDWTEVLLRELFFKVLNVIEKGEFSSKVAIQTVEEKRRWLLENVSDKEVLCYLSPRYILYVPKEQIREHIELYRNLKERPFVWKIKKNTSDIREVTICAPDRPGLFSNIAGVFALNNIDILEAQVFTWRNNIAMDIFKVRPPADRIYEDEIWEKIKKDLELALKGELNLREAIEKKSDFYIPKIRALSRSPKKVIVDNRSSSFFTIIEVHAPDFLGILFKITDAIFRCGLNIWVAKAATNENQIVDVFYVRDFDGQKVDDPEYVRKIKEEIKKVI